MEVFFSLLFAREERKLLGFDIIGILVKYGAEMIALKPVREWIRNKWKNYSPQFILLHHRQFCSDLLTFQKMLDHCISGGTFTRRTPQTMEDRLTTRPPYRICMSLRHRPMWCDFWGDLKKPPDLDLQNRCEGHKIRLFCEYHWPDGHNIVHALTSLFYMCERCESCRSVQKLFDTFRTPKKFDPQPESLVSLCLVKLSVCVGFNDDRNDRISQTGLYPSLQRRLIN